VIIVKVLLLVRNAPLRNIAEHISFAMSAENNVLFVDGALSAPFAILMSVTFAVEPCVKDVPHLMEWCVGDVKAMPSAETQRFLTSLMNLGFLQRR
jgi:hypothetical protein